MANNNLTAAKAAKNDEFYTRLEDISAECIHYKEHFKGKTIYCNCDDPKVSNFFLYFQMNFVRFGLKKLISTGFKAGAHGVLCIYDGKDMQTSELHGDGDFRSDECIKLLEEADMVVTNPPFSLFRAFVTLLASHEKEFLIIGNQNAVTYKELFPLIKADKMWWGLTMNGSNRWFRAPDEYQVEEKAAGYKVINGDKYFFVNGVRWFTNLPHAKRMHPIDFCKSYNAESERYPKYDNCDAIEVSRVSDIPFDYDGVMGVPITFLDKYCPEQFELIGHEHDLRGTGDSEDIGQFEINGKATYKRMLIRYKNGFCRKNAEINTERNQK